MKRQHIARLVAALLGCCAINPAALAEGTTESPAPIEKLFRDPPVSARPRTWWHWLNGNITEDGLLKDLAWMKAVGLGGAQAFDAYVPAPQIVERRLPYMSPEWQSAVRAAARQADILDLELGIPTSPGWSATGGPWVKPQDAMKKLVWSETQISGGKRFAGRLPVPPSMTGPFQSLRKSPDIADLMWGKNAPKWPALPEYYADIAVLAVPGTTGFAVPAQAMLNDGTPLPAATLSDDDLETGVTVPRGSSKSPTSVVLRFSSPQTIRSASFFVANAKMMAMDAALAPVLETSDDGKSWRKVTDIRATEVPTTVSFAEVKAKFFRLVLKPVPPAAIDLGAPAPGVEMPGDAAEFMKMMSAPWQLRQFRLSSEARIDQFEAKAGFAVAPDYYDLGERQDSAKAADPRSVIDVTAHLRADGSLDWTPPKGQWRIVRLGYSLVGATNHPANPEATGLEVDKYDAPAVRRYLDTYLTTYRTAVGPDYIGKRGIRALVSDSIEAGASNWTPDMIAQFKRLRGYDPTPWLPALAGILIGQRDQSDKFLFDYRRTLADLVASQHYGTLAEVAKANDLKIYGEALETHRFSLGDDMAMRQHASVPMAAMWTFGRGQKPNPSLIADIRGAASVAHIYGQNVVAAESMTSAMNYWNDSPASLKRIIDLEFVNGVNLPIIHTSVHSPSDDKLPGLSMFYFGQFFNRHESWADLARPWVDYLARNSFMLQQGTNVADVAYFYGEEAPLISLYGKSPVSDAPRTHAFDFVNSDALLTALGNDGDEIVTPGGARYRALYLGGSSQQMSLATLRGVARLAEGGATIIGAAPKADPGLQENPAEYAQLVGRLWPGQDSARVGKGRVIASRDVDGALASIGVAPQFHFEGAADASIPFVHRRLPDGDSFFLVNRQNREEIIKAHFRVTGKIPELWRAETGKIEALPYIVAGGETVVPITLAAEESAHIVFRQAETAKMTPVAQGTLTAVASLTGPWQVGFQSGRGAPANATFAELTPLNEAKEAGIKYFSGIATYSRDFRTPQQWTSGQALWLDLGKVGELAEIRINGKPAGTVWHAPFRLDIGPAVHKGANRLEVRVANLWVNRLIGDAQPGAQKVTFTALPAYRANAPLRPSGLIGPVQLFVQDK